MTESHRELADLAMTKVSEVFGDPVSQTRIQAAQIHALLAVDDTLHVIADQLESICGFLRPAGDADYDDLEIHEDMPK